MKKIGTQSIETKRLLLRTFVESDYQAMYDNWASRPDNLLHVTWDAYESLDFTAWFSEITEKFAAGAFSVEDGDSIWLDHDD